MSQNNSRAKQIPQSLQGILWSKNVQTLDLEKDKVYIIHQVLNYGSLQQIKWLFDIYSPKKVRAIFSNYPCKIYRPSIFYFVKNFILDLKNKTLSEKNYVRSPFRNA